MWNENDQLANEIDPNQLRSDFQPEFYQNPNNTLAENIQNALWQRGNHRMGISMLTRWIQESNELLQAPQGPQFIALLQQRLIMLQGFLEHHQENLELVEEFLAANI